MPAETIPRGALREIGDAAENLAAHLERLHDLDGRLADLSAVLASERALIAWRPSGWPRRVAEAVATVRTIATEAAEAHEAGATVPLVHVAELWNAADCIRQTTQSVPADTLTSRHLEILEAAHLLGALDELSRKPGRAIARKAAATDPKGWKRDLAELVRLRLLHAKRGKTGGYWLSPTGLAAVNSPT